MLNFSVIDDIKRWSRRGSAPDDSRVGDSLDIFGSEEAAAVPASHSQPTTAFSPFGDVRMRVAALLILVIILAGGLTGYLLRNWPILRVQAATGSITIESDPVGADVVSAGRSQGVTPLTVAVSPGDHLFEVIHNGRNRPLKVTVTAGGSAAHYVHFDTAPSAAEAGTGGVVEAPVRAVKAARKPAVPAGPAAGWVAVRSSVPLDIVEGGNTVGTSQSAKIMLPVGRHELRFSNEALGFSERRVVQVKAGSTAAVRVDLPNAPLSINAQPWAEIWIDGKRVGETPMGNHLVRIGSHEVILRHPELGERRRTVTVSLASPARVSVDMRKQ